MTLVAPRHYTISVSNDQLAAVISSGGVVNVRERKEFGTGARRRGWLQRVIVTMCLFLSSACDCDNLFIFIISVLL